MIIIFMRLSVTINADLCAAQSEKNKECRQLRRDIELKDGEIASLEEARKKDEGDKILPSFHLTTRSLRTFFRQAS